LSALLYEASKVSINATPVKSTRRMHVELRREI
jgi:hypothetical protein